MSVVCRLVDGGGVVLADFGRNANAFYPIGNIGHDEAREGRYMTLLTAINVSADATKRMRDRERIRTALRLAAENIRRRHRPRYVWFEFWQSGELPKRGVVWDGKVEEAGKSFIDGIGQTSRNASLIDSVIERGAFESLEPTVIEQTVDEQGGVIVLPPLGDIDGRIACIELGPRDHEGSLQVATETAIGIRHNNYGVGDFSAKAAIGTTYTFNNNDDNIVATFQFSDKFTGDMSHYAGRYHLYANITTSDLTLATLAIGVAGEFIGTPYVTREANVYIDGSDNYALLGEIDLPHAGAVDQEHASQIVAGLKMVVYGQLLDGTVGVTQITIDDVILTPVEHQLRIRGGYWTSDPGNGYYKQVVNVAPSNEVSGYSIHSETHQIYQYIEPETRNWVYPREGGLLVVHNPIQDSYGVTVRMVVYPRWEVYRTR